MIRTGTTIAVIHGSFNELGDKDDDKRDAGGDGDGAPASRSVVASTTSTTW